MRWLHSIFKSTPQKRRGREGELGGAWEEIETAVKEILNSLSGAEFNALMMGPHSGFTGLAHI